MWTSSSSGVVRDPPTGPGVPVDVAAHVDLAVLHHPALSFRPWGPPTVRHRCYGSVALVEHPRVDRSATSFGFDHPPG
ncbi:hypothetical protein FRAAL0415 [Frankia alni ACN14a]|uniref:Uncharacterized protein n=1 Tax=Frankia alni (strain DSM 45986 / CECT 9034 / ACN14a) TaxID=326424 RepID=Q0RTK8_FRAAA|nr:hypothetical protein FRAAL0415 [Frankia alni ACN14a]